MDNIREDLETLFRQTSQAHHRAFIETDGTDPDWPLWYAEYLMDKLPAMLANATFTRSELIYLLISADLEQKSTAPGANWALYCADFFMGRYL